MAGRSRSMAIALFAMVMSLNGFIFGVVSIHLVPLLQAVPGVRAVSAYGHTPGHTIYSIESKGEKLVLVTDRHDAESASLVAHAQFIGAPELAVPRKIIKVPEVPVLGTGKTDYVAIQRMAEADGRRAA